MDDKDKVWFLLVIMLCAALLGMVALLFIVVDDAGAVKTIPTPMKTAKPKAQKYYISLALYEYPWTNGTVTGIILSGDGSPYHGCFGLAKVWCDETSDPVVNRSGCVFVWDDAWSPRTWLNVDGSFELSTEVGYSVPTHRDQPPYDGGTGWFVPVITEYCTMMYGYYDILERAPGEAMVVRVFPENTESIGTQTTWLFDGIESAVIREGTVYTFELMPGG